jgi:hypothetical protein
MSVDQKPLDRLLTVDDIPVPQRISITILPGEPVPIEFVLKSHASPDIKLVPEEDIPEPVKKEPEDSLCPEGKRDWFYTLFGWCCAKKVMGKYDENYYHKVLWFKYTCDGNKCEGMYIAPDENYDEEAELYKPNCLFFTLITIRFIRRYICCIKDDD